MLFIFVCVFCLNVRLCTMCVPCPWSPEEGVKFLGTGVKDGCEPLCGCWEWDLGPLEEQPVLLTTEPSLQFLEAILSNSFPDLCCVNKLRSEFRFGAKNQREEIPFPSCIVFPRGNEMSGEGDR